MKKIILSEFKGQKVNKILSCFMKRDDALSSENFAEMNLEVEMIKRELKHQNKPLLDFCFNSYRKIFNFQYFF